MRLVQHAYLYKRYSLPAQLADNLNLAAQRIDPLDFAVRLGTEVESILYSSTKKVLVSTLVVFNAHLSSSSSAWQNIFRLRLVKENSWLRNMMPQRI